MPPRHACMVGGWRFSSCMKKKSSSRTEPPFSWFSGWVDTPCQSSQRSDIVCMCCIRKERELEEALRDPIDNVKPSLLSLSLATTVQYTHLNFLFFFSSFSFSPPLSGKRLQRNKNKKAGEYFRITIRGTTKLRIRLMNEFSYLV